MSLPRWSVQNRVAANLLAVVILVAGILAATTRLKLDLFPDVNTNFISVTVLDPTTSVAEEIERTITIPIEEELTNVRGISQIRSTSEDNFSTIFLEVDAAITNLDPVLNEVRQAVDKARPKLPPTIEPPVIDNFDIPLPLVTFTISYPPGYSLMELRPQLERLERDLRMVPGVSDVLVDGLDRREVWVEIDPFRLQSLNLSFEEVTDAVSRRNINVVGGRMDAAGGQRLVRMLGEIEAAEELAEVPIKQVGSRTVLLRDVANFLDRSEEERTLGQANLRPAVTLTIVKKRGADAIKTVTACRQIFDEAAAVLPEGIEAQTLSDTTRFIRVRINTVVQNGLQALVLVTVLLMLLLNWRMALVVAVGIPVSFAGTFLVLLLGGYTINLLSLFAMIMALGMVVDDAIVISENAYRYIQQGKKPLEAAVLGAQEVIWPVVGSVSTTVAAFLPLIWGEGIIGKFLVIVPVVVISTLAFSLLQAFLILPSHIADFVRLSPGAAEIAARPARGLWRRMGRMVALTYAEMRETVDEFLQRVIEIYTHGLIMALRWRYFCILGFFGILAAVGAGVGAGLVPFKLFATDFADILIVKLEMPRDFSLVQSKQMVQKLEERLVEDLPPEDVLALITRIGARLDATDQFLEYGTNLAMITIDLDEENPQARRPSEIARAVRGLLVEFPEFVSATANVQEGGPPVGRAVNVEIQGPDFARLRGLAEKIAEEIAAQPGLVNVGTDFPAGKTEFRVEVDEVKASRAGLDMTTIGRALQAGYRGLEAGRLRWGNEEVVLRVKMAERFRADPELLQYYRIINREGRAVDLSTVARIEQTSGLPRIKRINSERVITVSGDVDDRVTNSRQINQFVQSRMEDWLEDYPGYRLRLTGENEDTERSLEAMQFASIVALLLIYGLLAVITNSFLQPLVIMSVIPFGVVGVVLGLILMGEPLGLMAIMGTVALAGIVVNNSVVFVDFINRLRHQATRDPEANPRHQKLVLPGTVRWLSIVRSGRVRFRPVFLTTATTVAGLSNLAFTSTGQEQFLAPMAQAIIFGLSFASLLTMILIPCLYSVLDDLHQIPSRWRAARQDKVRTLQPVG
jgi:multidrug efflux pump subunit AcrB